MQEPQRLMPLAPGPTAVLRALGAADNIVGATEYATQPGDDWAVVGQWLAPDYSRIAELDPDIIFTSDALQEEIRDELRAREYTVCHTAPTTLSAVLDSFATIGRVIGATERATDLAAAAKRRLAHVQRQVSSRDTTPTVYCEEWPDPPMVAGNWIPDAVEIAGGHYPYLTAGDRSRTLVADDLRRHPPEYVVLHYCGQETESERVDALSRGWGDDATVVTFDDQFLNQPSPRLIDGVERLAGLLHDHSIPETSLADRI